MIIDSPFGKVSGQERVSAAKDLPHISSRHADHITCNKHRVQCRNNKKIPKTGKPIESIQKILQKNGRIGKSHEIGNGKNF